MQISSSSSVHGYRSEMSLHEEQRGAGAGAGQVPENDPWLGKIVKVGRNGNIPANCQTLLGNVKQNNLKYLKSWTLFEI